MLSIYYALMPSDNQQLHNEFEQIMQLTGGKDNLKHMSAQNVVIFNKSCNVASLKFKFTCSKTMAI